jgi:hypothetical protein
VNTPWYIKQMKEDPYYPEASPVPISLSDAQIDRISPAAWEPQTVELAVPREVYERYSVSDTAAINQGKISWHFKHTFQAGRSKAIRVQDRMVWDIVNTNKWEKPIYFAVTVSPDSKIGLDEYLWFKGLAWRLEPRKIPSQETGLDPVVLEENLFNEPDGFSKEPRYGYRFRNVANPDVYFDENVTRLMTNYRSSFIRLAIYKMNVESNPAKAEAVLDRMESVIPREKIPMSWDLSSDLANFYYKLGRKDMFDRISADIEPACWAMIQEGRGNVNSYYNPYRVLLDIYEIRRQPEKKLEVLALLKQRYPNDPGVQRRINEAEQELKTKGQATDSGKTG